MASGEVETEHLNVPLSPSSMDSPLQELRVPSDLSLDTQLVRTPLPRALSGIAPASWANPKGYMPLRSPTPPVRPHSFTEPLVTSSRYGSTSPLLNHDSQVENRKHTPPQSTHELHADESTSPAEDSEPTQNIEMPHESDNGASSSYSVESNDAPQFQPLQISQPAQFSRPKQNLQHLHAPPVVFPLPTIMERIPSPPRQTTSPSAATVPQDLDSGVRRFETPWGSLGTLPEQRMRIAYRDGISFTIMLVGESGSGKTTFTQMLLGDGTHNGHEPSRHGANSHHHYHHHTQTDPLKPLDVHRTTELEIHESFVEENGFKARFTIVDTPGFGDYTNNRYAWVPITNYVDSQYERYMCGEEQPCRAGLIDTRVHVCIYFLQPTDHKLLPLDITSMKEIGSRLNLVPVISKADSLTQTELLRFKKIVRDCVAKHDIPVFTVDEEFPSWPYALISSTDLVRAADGRQVHGRQYEWGTVEVDNPEHSDLSRLKEVLMGTQMLNLMDTTHEKHYKKQRLELRLRRLSLALKARPTGPAGLQSPPPSRPKGGIFTPTSPLKPVKQIIKTPAADVRTATDKQAIIEQARRMTGLEILTAVSPFGHRFLEEQRMEEDPLYKYRVRGITNNFDKVIQFQLQYFEKEAQEQEAKRQQFRAEIEELELSNRKLEQRIAELEASTSRRKR